MSAILFNTADNTDHRHLSAVIDMRLANIDDIPILVELMTAFYAEAGYELEQARAARAFADILANDKLGCVWMIQDGGEDAGHLVVTFRYAMEYGGNLACLDDLYVRPASRNKGLGVSAVMDLKEFCVQRGIRAMTVEVGHDNGPAQTVYRRAGFEASNNRQLFALELAPPTHVT